jgi:hypothetical protein
VDAPAGTEGAYGVFEQYHPIVRSTEAIAEIIADTAEKQFTLALM